MSSLLSHGWLFCNDDSTCITLESFDQMEACLARFIRRNLEDASNDDQNSYEETQGLLNTLYINSIIFAVFMTFYEMNRHMRSIYLKRLTSKFKVE